MVYESGFSRETEMVGCIHIVKNLLGVDHVIMEADESKMSFSLRGESPSSPRQPLLSWLGCHTVPGGGG